MSTILFARDHTGEFEPVSYEISKFSDISGWDKGRFDHTTHIKITNPFGILTVDCTVDSQEADEKKGRGFMRKIPFYIMAAVLFLAGILFVFYPLGRSVYSDYENKQIIKAFQNQKNTAAEQSEEADDKKTYEELLEQMEAYNQQIYETNQEGLKDAWSYQQNTFELSSFGQRRCSGKLKL